MPCPSNRGLETAVARRARATPAAGKVLGSSGHSTQRRGTREPHLGAPVGPEGKRLAKTLTGFPKHSRSSPAPGPTQPALGPRQGRLAPWRPGARGAGRKRGVPGACSPARFPPPSRARELTLAAPRPLPTGAPSAAHTPPTVLRLRGPGGLEPTPPLAARAPRPAARPAPRPWPRGASRAGTQPAAREPPPARRQQRRRGPAPGPRWSPRPPPPGRRAQPAPRSPDISSSFSISSANSRGSSSSVPSGPRMPSAGGRGGGRPPSRRARCQP